jgi:hypothetical protein
VLIGKTAKNPKITFNFKKKRGKGGKPERFKRSKKARNRPKLFLLNRGNVNINKNKVAEYKK